MAKKSNKAVDEVRTTGETPVPQPWQQPTRIVVVATIAEDAEPMTLRARSVRMVGEMLDVQTDEGWMRIDPANVLAIDLAGEFMD